MVSTRGPKYKFSEGERVLCYEPDPTKAKVLYDSKVLKVIEQKGKRGRRTVQYLIHFKGWNSSWDRYVGEELVLKDTEHNRQLQRTLAETAQLHIGTYLYRKERKKGVSTSSAGTTTAGKRSRVSDFEDEDLNNFSSQEEDVEDGQSEDVSQANSRSSTGGNSSSCEESESCNSEYNSDEYGGASIHIGATLRERLTQDYELVVCGGRLLRLPCRPNALQVLEGCVMQATNNTIAAHTPPPPQADVQEQARRLNILREVADGLRIYLDFILRDQLLYESERHQYYEAVASGILRDTQSSEVKSEEESNPNKVFPEEYSHLPSSLNIHSTNVKIKCEPLSPSRIKTEPESKPVSRNNIEPSQCTDWQNTRIKVEENIESKDITTHVEWNNQSKVKANQVIKCEDSRKHRNSPISRFNRRETRTSSCNSDTRHQGVNDNGQYHSDAGSSMSSHDGSQHNSEDCRLGTKHSSNIVNNKSNNSNNTDNGSVVNNNDSVTGGNNVRGGDSGRVLRGCVRKIEKTEPSNASLTNNNTSTTTTRNVRTRRRAKRPRLTTRRLRSQRSQNRIANSLTTPLPSQITSSLQLPNSQPDPLFNNQIDTLPNNQTNSLPNNQTNSLSSNQTISQLNNQIDSLFNNQTDALSNNQTDSLPNTNQATPIQVEEVTMATVSEQPGSSTCSDNVVPPVTQPTEINGNINDEFKGALEWRIVPPDYPPYPTTVYGAVHLARLFVKLPEYLSVINMPESKLEIIVEFIEYFIKYLEEHGEWFGESFYYIPNTSDS